MQAFFHAISETKKLFHFMDFSLWALFAGADFVVQLVMIALVAASMADSASRRPKKGTTLCSINLPATSGGMSSGKVATTPKGLA
ncbi:MAG: hypothetical protein ACPG7U_04750, partial [Holosporaceae bacterium]